MLRALAQLLLTRVPRRTLRAVLALVACTMVAVVPPARGQLTLPPDFADDLILGAIAQPVGMAFLPDGRLLFTERANARIRLIVNDAIAAVDPVITVPNVESAGGEQGLLGIAADPGWPARPYLYIHYDYSGSPTIRISRYTVGGDLAFTGDGSLTIDPLTRYDILTDIPDNASNHNGGTLRFGPDGKLYVSLGDDASSCQAQNLTVLAGKILRLDISGLPGGGGGPPAKSLITPADNPYVGNANANARLVGYWGLRNPFRFAIDPATGNLVIGDVGQSTEEELDYVSALGRNFQWPIYEGEVPGPTTCAGVDSTTFTDPILAYPRTQGQAVNGGVIYRRPAVGANRFPPEYDGDIFYCDFYKPYVRRLKQTGGVWAPAFTTGQPNANDWATGSIYVSDWLTAPNGSLWYCVLFSAGGAGPGQLRRIRYTGTTSVPPPPPVFEFRSPYPSPSSGSVSFAYQLAAESEVRLAIYDLRGRLVREVLRLPQGAGPHGAQWDGRDRHGRLAGAGVYVAALTVGGLRFERRFTLVR
jgi:glucose/arabinose dehydrogenase